MKNMYKVIALLVLFLLHSFAFAQKNNDAVLLTVGTESVTKGDFLTTYQKNNKLSEATLEDLRNYLELYINFKLKVLEGEALQLDTPKAFTRELAAYRNQSAQHYLIDKEVSDKLLDEAYERSKYNIRASHILINCKPGASPKDTLAAYNKALEIRNMILNGKSFADAAYEFSNDPSARDYTHPQTQKVQPGNKGDLGYFSVLDLIYPFETAVYNTAPGSISMPVKTDFGYHLIYVADKVPAISRINVAQIFIKESADAQQKIKDIYTKIEQGMPFEEAVKKYSEDERSAEKEGVMEPFSPSNRSGDFVKACISLKNPGDISQPVHSNLGWHIVKLIEIKPATINEESKYALKNRISRDMRSYKSKASLVEKLKKEYNYNDKGKKAAFKFFEKNIDSTFFTSPTQEDLSKLPGIEKLKPIFTFSGQQIPAKQFASFIMQYRASKVKNGVRPFLDAVYPIFVEEIMLEYEDQHLTEKYPEFKNLMQEYHDGMLLYEINTLQVWGKAIKDSVGLQNFYEEIKMNYPVDPAANPVEPKPFNEVKAAVITEYQNYLDKTWIAQLRQKYPVTINEEVFSTLLK